MPEKIYTVGHSNLSEGVFLELLQRHAITGIADVRSSPTSKAAPWSSHDELKRLLSNNRVAYSFLGDELGGRPKNSKLFKNGIADYSAMAHTQEFRSGIDRVLKGAKNYRIALMCAEREPLECHRCLLVGRYLKDSGHEVLNILHDGSCENQTQAENRLLSLQNTDLRQADWVADNRELLSNAYERQARSHAFAEGS